MSHENLAAALAAFQAHIPNIEKGKTAKVPTKSGPGFSYDYADLTTITEKVLPALAKEGLSWSALPTFTDGGVFVLDYRLMHESGEELSGKYPLPGVGASPQQMGSAITYARRYVLCSVTGVAPGGDDDDAQAAQAAHQPPAYAPRRGPSATTKPVPRLASEEQKEQIRQLASELSLSTAGLFQGLRAYGFAGTDLEDLTADVAAKSITGLEAKLAQTLAEIEREAAASTAELPIEGAQQ